ncbi:MAG: hypothetical protein JXK94_14295 [Deltaproteobacteria bacterium]|nr:hypothetical protein [Deltaproteobacteria bacterium]
MAKKVVKIQLVKEDLSPKQERLVEEFVANWRFKYVTRKDEELRKATGIPYSAKTMCNLDSLGKGPQGRIKFGRHIAYPARSFFEWFVKRIEEIDN